MKLYAVSDGPPSLAVRLTLKALKIPHELIPVDYGKGEHMTEEYAKMNPQKEIPVLDDDGFFLSESVAIMAYLCDKYAPDTPLYPKDATKRAIINHRLCFNMGFYYNFISQYTFAAIFFDYPRTERGLNKVKIALSTFDTYLRESKTKWAASNDLTIADFGLVCGTFALEAIGFSLKEYPLVDKWYSTFKKEYPELWAIVEPGLQEVIAFEKNPPNISHLKHPIHPHKKN